MVEKSEYSDLSKAGSDLDAIFEIEDDVSAEQFVPVVKPRSSTLTQRTNRSESAKVDEFSSIGVQSHLAKDDPSVDIEQGETSAKKSFEEAPISVAAELFRFAKLSTPNTIVMFMMYMQMATTLSIAAQHLGTAEMTGVSLASLTANLSGLTIVYGLLSAVDTLAPQSFGAGNMMEVGILVQRGIITVFATFIVTFLIFFNAESILLAVNQPPAESRLAGVFLRYHFLSVPALALWESSRRFMWSQDVTQWPFVIITCVALGIHVACLHTLLPRFGFVGAPISHVITNWSMCAGVALWIKIRRPHNPDTWKLNKEILILDRFFEIE